MEREDQDSLWSFLLSHTFQDTVKICDGYEHLEQGLYFNDYRSPVDWPVCLRAYFTRLSKSSS